jgi:hypothetical protein
VGKLSRDKGKRGENEIVGIFHQAGCPVAKRTAALQAGLRHYGQLAEADVWIGDGFHVEVKRQEVLRLPTWLRQLDGDCPDGRDGILFYRRSHERWRAVVRLALVQELESALVDAPGRCAPSAIPVLDTRSAAVGLTHRVEVDGVELAHRLVESGWLS